MIRKRIDDTDHPVRCGLFDLASGQEQAARKDEANRIARCRRDSCRGDVWVRHGEQSGREAVLGAQSHA